MSASIYVGCYGLFASRLAPTWDGWRLFGSWPTGLTQGFKQCRGIQPRNRMPIALSRFTRQQRIDDRFFYGFGGGQEQFADVVVVDHAQVVAGRCFFAFIRGGRHIVAGRKGDEDVAAVVFVAATGASQTEAGALGQASALVWQQRRVGC